MFKVPERRQMNSIPEVNPIQYYIVNTVADYINIDMRFIAAVATRPFTYYACL